MDIRISTIQYLILVALILCQVYVCLSYTFLDDNSIKVESDGQHFLLESSTHDHLSMVHDSIDGDQGFSVSSAKFLSSIKFEAIYQFGDSISDTGNYIQENPNCNCAQLPYGQTFFHKPTGRCSDGLLMIDYFTKFFNLPYLEPYLYERGNFNHGVNFAVAGATALNVSTLAMKGITGRYTNSSLFIQLDWFKSHLDSICSNASECKEKLAKALIMMGEIGGNDYNYAFFQRDSIESIYKMVPEVVQTIKTAIKEIINLGAIHIVVPGNFPIGCMTIYLYKFKTNNSAMYDELQCINYLNDFAKYHNDKLQEIIGELQQDYPNVTIIYADYFYNFKEMLRHSTSLGFQKDTMQKPCCSKCAGYGNSICKYPYKFINWDSIHLTQHSYQILAKWFIKNMFHDSPFVV